MDGEVLTPSHASLPSCSHCCRCHRCCCSCPCHFAPQLAAALQGLGRGGSSIPMWDALRSCTGACNLALTAAFTAAGCGGRCRGSGVLEGQGAHGPQAVVAHISEVEVAIEQQGVHLRLHTLRCGNRCQQARVQVIRKHAHASLRPHCFHDCCSGCCLHRCCMLLAGDERDERADVSVVVPPQPLTVNFVRPGIWLLLLLLLQPLRCKVLAALHKKQLQALDGCLQHTL
mmetsp:Transcript_25094/g.68179  ORF Transcript_25094/g.68179 Transcript_25094/m.68179 type:complete len:229 (-) Transcript_25094:113-799(-)